MCGDRIDFHGACPPTHRVDFDDLKTAPSRMPKRKKAASVTLRSKSDSVSPNRPRLDPHLRTYAASWESIPPTLPASVR